MQQLKKIVGDESLYENHVNPQWVRLLEVLGLDVRYVTCRGTELFTADGRRILDFNSGYCVHNVGHNHPAGGAGAQGRARPERTGDAAGPRSRARRRLGGALVCARRRPSEQGLLRELGERGRRGGDQVRPRPRRGVPGILYAAGRSTGSPAARCRSWTTPSGRDGFGPLLAETPARCRSRTSTRSTRRSRRGATPCSCSSRSRPKPA